MQFPAKGRIALAVLLFSLLLLWPASLNRSALIFYDTPTYLHGGAYTLRQAREFVAEPFRPSSVAASGSEQAQAGSTPPVRSITYSVFAYLSAIALPPGGLLTVWLQSLLVTLMMALLLDRAHLTDRRALAAAALILAALTNLPFYVSFLMPDILCAVVILWALLLARGTERLSRAESLFVLLAATFALTSHYGYLGLAAGLAVLGLLEAGLRRRLSLAVIILAVGPILLAIAANLAVSSLMFKDASVAPRRYPILLARSLADGPALWHLQRVCPAAGYEMCRDIETLPATVQGILWDEGGLISTRTNEQLDRIRREEPAILLGAFHDYPLQQSWSLMRNSVLQMGTFGLAEFAWAPLRRLPDRSWAEFPDDPGRTGLDAFDRIQTVIVLVALGYILVLALGRRLASVRQEPEMLLVLAAGLIANAVVFGGLSVPADRYQGRIIWMIPMFALILWLARRPAPIRHKED